jgi:hypothetical protein
MCHTVLNPSGIGENGLSVLGVRVQETGVDVDDSEESIASDGIIDDIVSVLHVPHRLTTRDSPINLSDDVAMVVMIAKETIPFHRQRGSDEDVMESCVP